MPSLQGLTSNLLNKSNTDNNLAALLSKAKSASSSGTSSDALAAGSSNSASRSSSGSSSSSSSSTSLDYNDSLTLFTTQLQYQDPTNPMQSYELASQLAQFSTVEQLTAANTNLTAIEAYLASLNNTDMMNLIGKEITGNGGGILVEDGTATGPSYTLSDSSTSYDLTVKIYDSDDTLVRTLTLSGQTPGTYTLDWDGLNSSGSAVDDGQYHCAITAEDTSGSTSTITATNKGNVYAYVVDSSSPYVILDDADGLQVPVADIAQIGGSESETIH
jgi:flagellar basal-body rod modification protein FlgD